MSEFFNRLAKELASVSADERTKKVAENGLKTKFKFSTGEVLSFDGIAEGDTKDDIVKAAKNAKERKVSFAKETAHGKKTDNVANATVSQVEELFAIIDNMRK